MDKNYRILNISFNWANTVKAVICCVTLKIPSELSELQYTLAVQGTGGNSFHERRTVEVKAKTLSIFVQTDKAMYKPSQPGNFMYRHYTVWY